MRDCCLLVMVDHTVTDEDATKVTGASQSELQIVADCFGMDPLTFETEVSLTETTTNMATTMIAVRLNAADCIERLLPVDYSWCWSGSRWAAP